MKYKVTLNDGVELLVTADKEVEAVRRAKEIKDKLSVEDDASSFARHVEGTVILNDAGEYGNYDLNYFLSLPKTHALRLSNEELRTNERMLPEWEKRVVEARRKADEEIKNAERMVRYTKEQIVGIKNVIREINKNEK